MQLNVVSNPAVQAHPTFQADSLSAKDTAAIWTAVVRAADIWGLSNSEASALMAVSPATYDRAKRAPDKAALDQDKLTRASLILGLFKALRIVFNGPLQTGWVKTANQGALFGGHSPLSIMLTGGIPVMLSVRQHLDALRGGT